MKIIINKTPSEMLSAYRNNRPKNGVTRLFLVKSENEVPIYGLHITGDDIFVLKLDRSEIPVDSQDVIELRD